MKVGKFLDTAPLNSVVSELLISNIRYLKEIRKISVNWIFATNWPFARCRLFTTRTRIHFVFSFMFKFGYLSEVKITKALICTRKQYTEGLW